MKKLQTFINIIFIAGIIVLVVALARQCGTHDAPGTGHSPDSTAYYKNKMGDTVAALRGAISDFAIRTREADSIAAVYRVKFKDLQSYVSAYLSGHTNLPPVDTSLHIKYRDRDTGSVSFLPLEVESMSQQFKNNYYTADVLIASDAKSSYLHLQQFDTITVLWTRVKTGSFFNRKTYVQVNASLANPDVHLYGLRAYRIPDARPKRFGIGLQAGYGWNGQAWKPYAGIGLTYSVIKF
jgi:hypothetical protein